MIIPPAQAQLTSYSATLVSGLPGYDQGKMLDKY